VGPRGYVVLLGGLTAFAGYTFVWWGWLFLHGQAGPGVTGPGLIDLVMPSRICKVRGLLAGASSAGTTATNLAAPPAVPTGPQTIPGTSQLTPAAAASIAGTITPGKPK
jgi:hypothetical protein